MPKRRIMKTRGTGKNTVEDRLLKAIANGQVNEYVDRMPSPVSRMMSRQLGPDEPVGLDDSRQTISIRRIDVRK